ncbi:MAG: threonine ammonia-lyase, partial [Chloroflexota bacterium]
NLRSKSVSAETTQLAGPTITDILRARKVVRRYLPSTPVIRPPALSEELGFDVVLKCENLQPIGAFKIRGGIYFMSQLSAEERSRGVVTASTGNHAQSVAYAAAQFGVRAVIFVPEVNNPGKVAATRRLGAEIVEVGPDFDTANEECRRFAEREQMRYIHPANEPWLIAGVGTYALELIEEEPDLDTVIVPVGGGSGVCGTATVFRALRPATNIIAVQTENMPAVHDSYHQKRMLSYDGGQTWAEGLATRVAFELPFTLMQELVDDVVLVGEEEMRQSMISLMETSRVVAEGAGATPLAAARKMRDELAGQRVGLIVSGGNVTADTIRRAFCDDSTWT